MSADAFHAHLDVCNRCATQPMNLCSAGARLLHAAVDGLKAATEPTCSSRGEAEPAWPTEALRAGSEQIRKTLALFASALASREPWTQQLSDELTAAKVGLRNLTSLAVTGRLSTPRAPAAEPDDEYERLHKQKMAILAAQQTEVEQERDLWKRRARQHFDTAGALRNENAALRERLAAPAAEPEKALLERCRVALRSIAPVYRHVDAAATRAKKRGDEKTAVALDHVYGRLCWMDYALGTMGERVGLPLLTPEPFDATPALRPSGHTPRTVHPDETDG